MIGHHALDYGNNAFTWSFLILHSVSSGCRSDFSSCNSYPLSSMTAREGFSHMSICHAQVCSAICAIRLWHAAVMQGKGRLSVKREPSQQTRCLSALFTPAWRFYQSPGQLEVVEGEFFTLWGNINCQQPCSADVGCEMDGWMWPKEQADIRCRSGVQSADTPHVAPKDDDSICCGLRSKTAPSAETVPKLI